MNNEERDAGITRFLDNCPDFCVPTPDDQQMIPIGCEDTICFQWAKPGTGFGGFIFYYKDGKLYCDNECMSKEFLKERLCKMVDDAELTESWDDAKDTD
jgi:hypothetical protein